MKRIDGRGLEERALLAAARAGDARAFRCLLDRHRFGLELYCYLMVGGDVAFARRVLTDAVLTGWRERGFVGPETDARMWLYKLASRVCIEAADDHLLDRGPTNGSCR
jgi:RNA polymerase sigma-70 factor, ECF subfamily